MLAEAPDAPEATEAPDADRPEPGAAAEWSPPPVSSPTRRGRSPRRTAAGFVAFALALGVGIAGTILMWPHASASVRGVAVPVVSLSSESFAPTPSPAAHRLVAAPSQIRDYQRLSDASNHDLLAAIVSIIRAAGVDENTTGTLVVGYTRQNADFLLLTRSDTNNPALSRILKSTSSDQITSNIGTQLGLSAVIAVDPGTYGGTLRCGEQHSASGSAGICVWADNDTIGMAIAPDASAGAALAFVATVRSEIEK